MEWLEGEDLRGRLVRGRLSVEERVAVVTGVAQGAAGVEPRGERASGRPRCTGSSGRSSHEHRGALADEPRSSDPEDYLLRAIDIARCRGASLLDLGVMTSLGRLWRDEGNTDEAREMLARASPVSTRSSTS